MSDLERTLAYKADAEAMASKYCAELVALRLAIREHRNATERDFSADITIADQRLWEVIK